MSTTSALVSNTGGNVYVSSGNTVVTWLSITNYSAGNATANVHVVPASGTANSQNVIISNVLITVSDTLQLYTGNEKLILDGSTAIYIISNSSPALNSVISYTSA